MMYAEEIARILAGESRSTVSSISAPSTPADECFAAWLESLENTHAESTAGLWEIYVRHFLETFTTIADFTPAKIGDYMRRRLGLALRTTVKKELSALRHFLRWAKEQEYIAAPPDVPAVPKSALGTRTGTRKAEHLAVPPDVAQAVLGALPEWSSQRHPDRFRVRAYFCVLWETGLRPSTVQRLRVPEHYRAGATHLAIADEIDKARFGRKLPLTDAARAALDGACPESGPLFGEHDWRGFLEKAAAKANVDPSIAEVLSPYDLRHGRTTHLVEETGNLVGVAFLVGHLQVTTTNGYVHPTERAARAVLDRCGENSGERVVRGGGLEPPRCYPLAPQASVIAKPRPLLAGSTVKKTQKTSRRCSVLGRPPQSSAMR